jgi:hypothetical protein
MAHHVYTKVKVILALLNSQAQFGYFAIHTRPVRDEMLVENTTPRCSSADQNFDAAALVTSNKLRVASYEQQITGYRLRVVSTRNL